MKFTRILLSIVFVVFASTALAGKPEKKSKPDKKPKPEKILVCHVDSEAGKVDLILVSTNANHIGNPAHYFEDDTGYPWEDYSPEDGVGDDPLDFEEGDVDGIDRGCELEQMLTCPCWSSFTASTLLSFVDPCSTPDSSQVRGAGSSYVTMELIYEAYPYDTHSKIQAYAPPRTGSCAIAGPQVDVFMLLPDSEAAAQCHAESLAVFLQTGYVCPD